MNAIEFENIGKLYHLGLVGTGTLSHDLNRWWQTKILRREDPYLKVGEVNDRASKGSSDFVWALRNISFNVEEGEVVGIIGKNGAGKSTLLKLLSRVTAPTTGEIRARGRIASLLEVGTGFHGEMTGRENIYMNGSIMGMTRSEINAKLDDIVDFSGVARYIDTPVKRYSSGMTVRLGFAVAAFLEPEILVVDEVLAVGDAEFQKKAIGKMQDVSRGEGRTVLFVSHNMSAVRSLCQRGIVLDNGGMVFDGDVEDAVDQYLKTSFVSVKDIPVAQLPRYGRTSGDIRYDSIEYLDDAGRPVEPQCGSPLTIRVGFEVPEGVTAHSSQLTMEIHDMYEHPLVYFDSRFTEDNRTFESGHHYFEVRLDSLPLTEGDYRILLWAYCNHRVADYIHCTIPFPVKPGLFFPNIQNFPAHLRGKLVLERYDWKYD